MFNSVITYTLIQDGITTENTLYGRYDFVGSFFRVVFFIDVDGSQSEHSYIKTSDSSFKISVKGNVSYSVDVKQGVTSNAVLKTDGVVFPFEVFANKCEITANEYEMNIYAEYDMITFGQKINNVLKLKVCKKGDIEC